MESIKLIQCYHCFQFLHTRPNCPNISELATCSRCGGSHTHSYTECDAPHKCSNCDGPHPSTARTCPVYQTKLLEHEETLLVELVKKHPELVKNILNKFQIPISPQSDLNDIGSILRAARLASHSPEDFTSQLYNATEYLVTNTSPLNSYNDNLNFAFDCIAEEPDDYSDALNNTEGDISNSTLTLNNTANTTRNSNISFHVNQDLVVEQPKEFITNHVIKDYPELTTEEDFLVFSQQEFKINEKKKGIYPTHCILQTKSNLGNKMFSLVHIFFLNIMNLLVLAGTNTSQTYQFTKQILLDQISNIKYLEEHEILITMLDSTEYLLKIFKGWNGSSKEKTRDPDGAQAITEFINSKTKMPKLKSTQITNTNVGVYTHYLSETGPKLCYPNQKFNEAAPHYVNTDFLDKQMLSYIFFNNKTKEIVMHKYDDTISKINAKDISKITLKEHKTEIWTHSSKDYPEYAIRFHKPEKDENNMLAFKERSPENAKTATEWLQNNICKE